MLAGKAGRLAGATYKLGLVSHCKAFEHDLTGREALRGWKQESGRISDHTHTLWKVE